KENAEIAVQQSRVGEDLERCFELTKSARVIAVYIQQDAQIDLRFLHRRIDRDSLPVQFNRFRQPALLAPEVCEVHEGDVIVACDRQRMLEQAAAVPPIANLRLTGERTGNSCQNGRGIENLSCAYQSTRAPNEHDENADRRQISIAIRHGLETDLHDANYRNQHAQIPKPAGKQIGTPLTNQEHGQTHAGQQYRPEYN